jgi:hypothetical protein
VGSLLKPKLRLAAENAALRHQLIVSRRKMRGRAWLTNNDRWFFIQMYRWFPSILQEPEPPLSNATNCRNAYDDGQGVLSAAFVCRLKGQGSPIAFFKLFKSFEESAPIARQIVTNSTTSIRRSPPSYLATKDCGRRRRLASSCCVRSAVLRALIINSQKTACSVEWTDLSSLRARVAIGAED